MKYAIVLTALLGLLGCQSTPPVPPQPPTPAKVAIPQEIRDPSGVIIRTYDHPEIQRKTLEQPK